MGLVTAKLNHFVTFFELLEADHAHVLAEHLLNPIFRLFDETRDIGALARIVGHSIPIYRTTEATLPNNCNYKESVDQQERRKSHKQDTVVDDVHGDKRVLWGMTVPIEVQNVPDQLKMVSVVSYNAPGQDCQCAKGYL